MLGAAGEHSCHSRCAMSARHPAAILMSGLAMLLTVSMSGCDYVRLLRPSVLKQLNPDVVKLLNELPTVDDPNDAIVARLFAHGGLSHAERGSDGSAIRFASPGTSTSGVRRSW